jgi:hypothetical protein
MFVSGDDAAMFRMDAIFVDGKTAVVFALWGIATGSGTEGALVRPTDAATEGIGVGCRKININKASSKTNTPRPRKKIRFTAAPPVTVFQPQLPRSGNKISAQLDCVSKQLAGGSLP